MIRIAATTIGLAAVAILIAIGGRPAPRIVSACSGGIGPLEFFAPGAELIFLGTVTDVGDNINRAPTLGPTDTPTASPTPEPPTPVPSPEPTMPPFPRAEPVIVDLVGVQASLRVERLYAGEGPDVYVTGQGSRAGIEAALRKNEAGLHNISSCTIDAFVPRYELGGQYLLFVEQDGASEYVSAVFRVSGGQIVADDPLLNAAGQGFLLTQADTYTRFFPGIEANVQEGTAYFGTSSVPLDQLLAAVAYLLGDPTIYPPDTGSAGLKPSARAN